MKRIILLVMFCIIASTGMAADHGHGRSGRSSHNGGRDNHRGGLNYYHGPRYYGSSYGIYISPYSGPHYEWVYHYGRFGPYWSYELVY